MKQSDRRFQKALQKSKGNRLLAVVLCASLILSAFAGISFARPKKAEAEAQGNMLSNPRIVADNSMQAKQKVTWDCVWFGSYPQAEVVSASREYTALDKKMLREGDLIKDDGLYQTLQAATGWDEKGDIVISGDKYRRIKKEDATYTSTGSGYYQWKNETDYHYFKYQPIKWRVLSVNGSEAFLLADQALDGKQYHTGFESVTWEGSTIRSWLNGYGASANQQKKDYSSSNFINTAFGASARTAIKDTKVENKDNLSYGTEGGKDTVDKVFLLSESEVYTDNAKGYGFVSGYSVYDEARRAKLSVYAKALGTWSSDSVGYVGNCWWWLRSPGNSSGDAASVHSVGRVYRSNGYVGDCTNGVRPALNLNLAASPDAGSPNLWSYAGTVCSDGTVDENGGGEGIDNSGVRQETPENISVIVRALNPLTPMDGARVTIEGIGEGVTKSEDRSTNGIKNFLLSRCAIRNTLSEPSAMKKVTITKDGYRDYIFYTTFVHPDLVTLFNTNEIGITMKEKQAGEESNPYLSTFKYYSNEVARDCNGQSFSAREKIRFRACGVWNSRQAGYYYLYQEGGQSFTSTDGIFELEMGKSFSKKGAVYLKMVSADGYETKPEKIDLRLSGYGFDSAVEDTGISLSNGIGESGDMPDVPFLNGGKLSFDLGKIKTSVIRKGTKIKIMLGADFGDKLSSQTLEDKDWESWKKFCEMQPSDLSLSQWKNVADAKLETHWTSSATLGATGYGWLEGDLSNRSFLTGGIQVKVDGKIGFKQQYFVGVVPIYAEVNFGAKGQVEGTVSYDMEKNKLTGDNQTTVEPYFSAEAGVGVLYVATVGVSGSASMPIKFSLPQGLVSGELTCALSLNANVLGFKYSNEFVKKTYVLYPNDASGGKKSMKNGNSLYEMNRYGLPDKDEIVKSKWVGTAAHAARKSVSASHSKWTEKVLEIGTSALTEPVLVHTKDATMAVFLMEDTDRSVIHRTKLVYSLYDEVNDTWKKPVAVSDDGTGDSVPFVSENDGRISVSWLNYSNNLTDAATMEEALKTSKLCAASWNNSRQVFEMANRTFHSFGNESFNSMRSILDSNNQYTFVGIKNTAADIFGIKGDNRLLFNGSYNGNNINKEIVLKEGIPVSYDVAEVNGQIQAVVCMDTDSDANTIDDRELYLYDSSGNVKRLTDNQLIDSSPKYVDWNGEKVLFWYCDGTYKLMDSKGAIKTIYRDENKLNSESFTIATGSGGQCALVWNTSDEDGVFQIKAAIYDKKSDSWTESIFLSDSDKSIQKVDGYYDTDGVLRFLYTKNGGEAGRTLCVLECASCPDVEVAEAYIEDGKEVAGKSTTVFVGVTNTGTEPVRKYVIEVDGQVTEGDNEILPGASKLLKADYMVPEKVANRDVDITVRVDRDADESNNKTTLTMGYSDLSILLDEETVDNGKIAHVTAANMEAVTANAILEVHKNSADGDILDRKSLGSLEQGDIVSVDYYLQDYGTYPADAEQLFFVVKSDVREKYESNNEEFIVLPQNEGDTPDSPTIKPSVSSTPTLSPAPKPSDVPIITPTASPTSAPDDLYIPFKPIIIPGSVPMVTLAPSASPSVLPTATPSKTPEVVPSGMPTATPAPSITPEPSAMPTNTPKADDNKKPAKNLKRGTMVSDSKTKAVYKVIRTGKNKAVEYVRSTKKNASKITIPAKVKLQGQNYKVTSIAKNALKNNKKLSYVIIGKNVKKIGKKAFYGCKKLRYIYMKSKKLAAKNIGKQAFGNGYKSPRVKSAKSVWRRYARVLPAKGLSKRAVYIINPVKLVL